MTSRVRSPVSTTYSPAIRTATPAAAANLKKGLTYLEQNDIQKAILQLRYVNTQYSGTDEGKIARDKLASLGAPV